MVMVVGEGGNNASAELRGLRMGQFQHRYLLQMVVQEPGLIDQGLQDQRLAAGHRAALATHDRAGRELGAGRLVGARLTPELLPTPGPAASNRLAWLGLEPLRGAKRRPDSPPPAPRK